MERDITIRGSVTIVVDAVDMEQAEIESPALLKENPSIKAMLAARGRDSFKTIQSVCERNQHAVEYDFCEPLSQGRAAVTFTVRPKTFEELKNG